jgi:hypothetical protein
MSIANVVLTHNSWSATYVRTRSILLGCKDLRKSRTSAGSATTLLTLRGSKVLQAGGPNYSPQTLRSRRSRLI